MITECWLFKLELIPGVIDIIDRSGIEISFSAEQANDICSAVRLIESFIKDCTERIERQSRFA